MPDIVVTLPAKVEWADYRKELAAVADGKQEMLFRVPTMPNVSPGDRCYVVHRGAVVGWMKIVSTRRGPFTCTTTGKSWSEGCYVARSGPWHPAGGRVEMPGFQGFRYARNTPLASSPGGNPVAEQTILLGL